MSSPDRINFSVDAALLRELGERLVGQPHIAAAELVKNSYDADASLATVRIEQDRIVVEDNGSGMSEKEFRDFWMRIGSTHKLKQGTSRHHGRPLTGSKGVGRLAVQFLGRRVSVSTTSDVRGSHELIATVDWAQADTASELTNVVALLSQEATAGQYADKANHGCRITITGLHHDWSDPVAAEHLAAALWQLQSPIPLGTNRGEGDFEVTLESSIPEAREKFLDRILAPLDLWYAHIRGELVDGDDEQSAKLKTSLVFRDEPKPHHYVFDIPNRALERLSFELRVYALYGRQQSGIAVEKAREYMDQHGGVKIYDNGFRLPYYGLEHDWLNIERDHSHRFVTSKVLPQSLRVERGLANLPTQTRVLGFVFVNTSQEGAKARMRPGARPDYLQIQVSRDRLVDNAAFAQLQLCVRLSLDWYATRETVRKLKDAEREVTSLSPPEQRVKSVTKILQRYENKLPQGEIKRVIKEIESVVDVESAGRDLLSQNVNLLGALATAGIFALSFEHEIGRQLSILEGLAARLSTLGKQGEQIKKEFDRWVSRVRQTRSIFTALSEDESRRKRLPFPAREAIAQFAKQAAPFLSNAEISVGGVDEILRLPGGTFAEWSAVFQNVFANAANALLDARIKRISVSSERRGNSVMILVQDTGVGVDLRDADKLFEPFERKIKISRERRAMAVGGTGLGLTIVRTIAQNLGCTVSFDKPSKGFSTCFKLTWRD